MVRGIFNRRKNNKSIDNKKQVRYNKDNQEKGF